VKSLSIRNVAGQHKLRGKKTKNLSCGCCTITNFKEDCINKELDTWANEFKNRQITLDPDIEAKLKEKNT
jgi:hypothetical protein